MTSLTSIVDGTSYTVSMNALPPVEYLFHQPPLRNGTEKVFCHGLFNETKLGNTVVWEFVDDPAPLPLTWPNNTSIQPLVTVGSQKVSHSKSTAISVGLGIGVAVIILLIVGVIAFFIKRCRFRLERSPKTNQMKQIELEAISPTHNPLDTAKPGSTHNSTASKERPQIVELNSHENQLIELPGTSRHDYKPNQEVPTTIQIEKSAH
jgi:hypothetical protein